MTFKLQEPGARPSWWTPEAVLECLRNGERVSVLCQRAAQETDCKVVASRLRADIRKWSESLTWGEQFTAALAIYLSRGEARINTEWYQGFYDAMRQCDGRMADACELAGIGPDLVLALRDKRNACYDKAFDEQVRQLEGLRFVVIRENLLDQATRPTIEGAKLGATILESALPGLHAKRQQLEVTGKIEHEHQYLLPPEVVAAGQARMRTLMAGREKRRALPPSPVDYVDGEVVSEKARA